MGYTDKMMWEDKSKILYAPYYAALAHKQHGSGLISEKVFLQRKIDIAKEMFSLLGGKDPSFLELLFTADSLAATPFGFGGRKVLKEEYAYKREKITQIIAQELQLSDTLISSLSPMENQSLEAAILSGISPLFEAADVITEEIKQKLMKCAAMGRIRRDIEGIIAEQSLSPEQAERIAEQESRMLFAVEVLRRDGPPDGGEPLMYLLRTKEEDFARKKKEKVKIQPEKTLTPEEMELPINMFVYNDNKLYGGIVITKYIGSLPDVRIPEQIDGKPVVCLAHAVFHETDVVTCDIPDSVVTLSQSVFYDCAKLTGVKIPDKITEINGWMFHGCTGLTSFIIPGSVTKIGAGAFKGCTGLTEITIPDGVKVIEYAAFNGCTGITSVTIPASVERLSLTAFDQGVNLNILPGKNSKQNEL